MIESYRVKGGLRAQVSGIPSSKTRALEYKIYRALEGEIDTLHPDGVFDSLLNVNRDLEDDIFYRVIKRI